MNIITLPLDPWPGHDTVYKYDERTASIKYIVLHTTGGIDSKKWLSEWNKQNHNSEQNNVSVHYLIQRDGTIYRIIDDTKRAWHVGVSRMPDGETDGNSVALGIEIEHLNESDFPDVQLNSVAILVNELSTKYHILRKHVVSHASVATPLGRKIDPVQFNWNDLWQRVDALGSSEKTSQQLPYTSTALTLFTPQIDAQKLTEYIAKHHLYTQYTQADVRLITHYYITYGLTTGVDYLFALGQMIHETGWLESWWSARPRRNPAGIGVTGQTSIKDPKDIQNWAQSGKIWKRGQLFESWDIAVQHHLARILCYALKDNEMNEVQLQFSQNCRGRERLDTIRGCAKQWNGFNGVWAVPGRNYAERIVTIINSIITRL